MDNTLTISFLPSIKVVQKIELNEEAVKYGVTVDNFLSFLEKNKKDYIQLSLDENNNDVVLYLNSDVVDSIVIGKVVTQNFQEDKYNLMVENNHTFFEIV